MGLRWWLVIPWEARVIDQCDFLNLWFRRAMSGSYHDSYLNRRIFRKFATLIISGVNNSSYPGEYETRVMWVNNKYRFLKLII